MTKGLKPIIITVSIIVVLIAAILLLIFVFPPAEAQIEDPAETTQSSGTVYVVNEDSSALKSFEAIYSDGSSFLVEISLDSAGTYSYKVNPATEYFDYDTSKFRSMIYNVTSISATNVVEENPANLSIYGLDDPQFTMRTVYSGGRKLELYIGSATPTDSNYYAKTNEDDTVYTIGSYLVSLLMRTELDYRVITLFPTYTEDEIYENINWVKMTLRDGMVVEIMRDQNYDHEANFMGSNYVMLSPTATSCNDTYIESKVLDVVALLAAETVLTDISEDEYPEYGFDNPAKLEMTDTSGNSVSIYIGDKYSSGYYYVMLEQAPQTVLLCAVDAFEWLSVNYVQLMSSLAWLQSINDVASIDYNMNGDKYSLVFDFQTETNEDGEEKDVLYAHLNGEEISDTNGRRLFTRTLNFSLVGEIPADSRLGKADYTITMNLLSGEKRTLELIRINDRQYACKVDGVAGYYVYRKNIETLISAFGTVTSGRELPMSYS